MQNEKFTDVHYTDTPNPSIAFRTGLTVYQESLINGQYIGRGWNGQGFLLEPWTQLEPKAYPTPQAFWLEIDGQELLSHWNWEGLTQKNEGDKLTAVVTLKHQVRPVTVKIHTALDGTPILMRWLEITNTGDKPAAISACYPLSGVLHTSGDLGRNLQSGADIHHYSIGYMAEDGWGHEGVFRWEAIKDTGFKIEGRYRRGKHRHPMFAVRDELNGEHFIAQFAWSGGYAFEFDYYGGSHKKVTESNLFFRVGMAAPAPLRVISPGETVKTPEVLIGMVCADFDSAVQAMHDHLRKSFFMPQPKGRCGWIEAAVGPEYELNPELVHQAISTAAQFGAEIFFIDASWYGDVGTTWWTTIGDWNVGNRFPNGLKEFREHAHKEGMLWGLWMEPERLGAKCRTIKEHPEFLGAGYDQKGYEGEDFAGLIDLTNPAAARWMEDQICRVITEYELDFFRLDANFETGIIQWNERHGYIENNAWRYYETLYGIFDRIRERFPDLVIENCSSGGGRTDVGMVRRFSHTWVTDWQPAPRSFSITNGMTIALPPEYVDRQLIGTGMSSNVSAEIDFQARLCLFGRPTIAGILWPLGAKPNPLLIERIKHMVDIHKNFVRPIIDTGRIYHHTPAITQPDPEGIGVIEMASRDKTKAIAGLFALSKFEEKEFTLRLRGLDAGLRYKVTSDNTGSSFETDGSELIYSGLNIRLGTALTSELILAEQI